VTLVCKASDKIRSCSWSTPYGKTYPLESGLMAEGGRLLHFTTDKDKECGVLITNIEAKDNGRWKCNVGVVENSEVTTASGMANVSIATPPTDIFLEEPFEQKSSNFTLGLTYDIKCVVKNAKPAPQYVWKINDEEIDGKKMDEEVFVDQTGISTFTQMFSYTPMKDHANKTIKCLVQHPGLSKAVSAGTEVKVVGGEEASVAAAALSTGAVVGIVVVLLVILAAAGVSTAAWKGKFNKKEEKEKLDEEKGATEGEADKTSQTESAHDNNIHEAKSEEKKSFNIHTKINNLFAALKPKESKGDEIVATEWEKVDLTEAKSAETENGDEKKDEEKEEAIESHKVSFGGKVSSFFAKFKPTNKNTMKETPEEQKVETVSTEDDLKELEPEEKNVDDKEKRIGSETPV